MLEVWDGGKVRWWDDEAGNRRWWMMDDGMVVENMVGW